jgi:hypothetical protein
MNTSPISTLRSNSAGGEVLWRARSSARDIIATRDLSLNSV